ncbi:nitrous oxide reductase accessory protein NosL [Polaromonas sp.]|uniref:nitrous oxide reductase accessory protein NosL n=1 Tax=Polaromonas sp. TaxID=1869339 RepID=UPI0027312A54|nr:nitrous oxide reductase accessory protein NosL [Polaromonas sp.]MDP2448938.1 nitrous oxide reductase accessory protein NosL [Polaromonas sp.]MDP3755601.1 nitrous oxide reductase accessory protein NosL [Polaromonas sp.]
MMLRGLALRPLYFAGFAGLVLLGGLLLAPWRSQPSHEAVLVETDEICVVAPPVPHDPKSGLGLHAPRPVPADARCPVCGMYPARSPEWAAQVIFDNGDTQFFDSPLSLFTYLQDVGRYTRGRQASKVAASYVTDASSGAWIRAMDAVYVNGSSAAGPMRAGNLPAFSSAALAQRFVSARGGVLLEAGQISPQLLQNLNGERRHAHVESPP